MRGSRVDAGSIRADFEPAAIPAEQLTNTPAGPYSIGSSQWPGVSKVMEECGELLQVLGKIVGSGGNLQHWSGDLGAALTDEVADLEAALEYFKRMNAGRVAWDHARRAAKLTKFMAWDRRDRVPGSGVGAGVAAESWTACVHDWVPHYTVRSGAPVAYFCKLCGARSGVPSAGGAPAHTKIPDPARCNHMMVHCTDGLGNTGQQCVICGHKMALGASDGAGA